MTRGIEQWRVSILGQWPEVGIMVLRVILAVCAFLCGVRALGYWAILQVGGVRPTQRDGIDFVVYSSAFLFLVLSLASAYLRERVSGVQAIAVKTLHLTGAHGLASIALFTVSSKGAVLGMPGMTSLLILFACFVLAFRPPIPKHNT